MAIQSPPAVTKKTDRMIDRRRVIGSIGFAALAWSPSARSQPARKVARIGIVSIGGPSADMTGSLPRNRNVRAFLRGMAELGYVFGRDFVTEARGTDSIPLVAELADLQVDMIVATGGGATLSLLKQATTTIPIIMTAAPDPVSQGFAQSLARPGGNFTGMSLQSLELTGKRLQLLKELVPGARTVAVFWDPTDRELWPVAQAFGQTQSWKLFSVEIRNSSEIAMAFKVAVDAGAGALLIPASGLLFSRASQIAELAALSRLPTMYELRPFVDVGGLVSYGADIEDIWRRAATYVDKILNGAHPAELPIEQPTKFELVINSRAAKALGLTIPPSIMVRADDVIE
jgi:putative tryptophan/tyrosine transport system substrate-binding protein